MPWRVFSCCGCLFRLGHVPGLIQQQPAQVPFANVSAVAFVWLRGAESVSPAICASYALSCFRPGSSCRRADCLITRSGHFCVIQASVLSRCCTSLPADRFAHQKGAPTAHHFRRTTLQISQCNRVGFRCGQSGSFRSCSGKCLYISSCFSRMATPSTRTAGRR